MFEKGSDIHAFHIKKYCHRALLDVKTIPSNQNTTVKFEISELN